MIICLFVNKKKRKRPLKFNHFYFFNRFIINKLYIYYISYHFIASFMLYYKIINMIVFMGRKLWFEKKLFFVLNLIFFCLIIKNSEEEKLKTHFLYAIILLQHIRVDINVSFF